MKSISRETAISSLEAVGARKSLESFPSLDLSDKKPSIAFIDNTRYRFSSKKDFVISTMTCIFSTDVFFSFVQSKDDEPGVYHYAITFAFLGLPVYYLQLLLGQYTQLGIILLKYLSPISHGVALFFIMNLVLRTIMQSIILDEAIVFFLTSMQSELQWLMCPPEKNIPCYDGTVNCTNLICKPNRTKVVLPADIFFNHHFLKNPVMAASNIKLVLPDFQKISIHGINWFAICVILICTINHYMGVIRFLHFTTLLLLFFLTSVTTLPYLGGSLADLFAIRTKSFLNLQPWLKAVFRTNQLMALGSSFHVIHGSYLNTNELCAKYALVVVVVHFLLIIVCCLFTITCVNTVASYANLDKDHWHLFFEHGRQSLFVAIPQALGSLGIPQLWSCIYFAIMILIGISQQLSHLTFTQMSLCDIYPSLLKYKKYGVILFGLLSGLVSCVLMSSESYLLYLIVVVRLPKFVSAINLILMTFVVCYIYGLQRFIDDIHFTTGQPPGKFWRICWYSIPLVLAYAFVHSQIDEYETTEYNERLLQIGILLAYISPVPIVAIMETLKFIKARNLIGLFQPDERFGPPDPHERELRRMFNPRTETKSRRRMQVCKHRCLLGSKPLMTITKTEMETLITHIHATYDDHVILEEID